MTDAPANVVIVADIKRAVAARYQLSVNDMVSPRRHARTVRARMLAMYLARVLTLKSMTTIARQFGDREHSTVCYAVAYVEARMPHDVKLARQVKSLLAELLANGAFACWENSEVRAFDASLADIGFELAIVPIGSRDKNGFLKIGKDRQHETERTIRDRVDDRDHPRPQGAG